MHTILPTLLSLTCFLFWPLKRTLYAPAFEAKLKRIFHEDLLLGTCFKYVRCIKIHVALE